MRKEGRGRREGRRKAKVEGEIQGGVQTCWYRVQILSGGGDGGIKITFRGNKRHDSRPQKTSCLIVFGRSPLSVQYGTAITDRKRSHNMRRKH